MIPIECIDPATVWHPSMKTSLLIHGLLGSPLFGRGIVTVVLLRSQSDHTLQLSQGVFFPVCSAGPELPLRRLQSESTIPSGTHLSLESPLPGVKNGSPVVFKLLQNVDNSFVERALNLTQVYKRLNYGAHKRFNDFKLLVTAYYNITIWSLL